MFIKKTIALILFIFINVTYCWSQKNTIPLEDSKQERIDQSLENTKSNNAHNEQRYKKFKNNLLSKVTRVNASIEEKVESYYQLASIENLQSNFEKAMEYMLLMKEYAEQIDDTHAIIISINLIGLNYNHQGNYDIAIEYYYKALKLAEKTSDIIMIIAIKGNIASLNIEANNLNEGISKLQENLKEIETSTVEKTKVFLPEIYNQLCSAYTRNNQYKEAATYCALGMELTTKLKSHFIEAELLQNYANLEILKGNFDKAANLLITANDKITKHLLTERIPYYHLYNGKLYFYTQQYKKAIKELLKVEQIYEKEKIKYLGLQETNALLAKAYASINTKDSAYFYFEKAIATNETNSKKKNEIISQIVHNQGLLQIENSIKDLKRKNERKNTFIKIGGSLCIMVIILSVFFAIRSKKRNIKKFNDLIHKIDENQLFIASKNKKETQLKREAHYFAKEETYSKILESLRELEKKHFFLHENCNRNTTAKKLKTNVTYLSKVIRYNYNCDFTQYINNLRINYVIKRLKEDQVFRSYSIKAISEEIGYKSMTSFVKHFKNHTKLAPSYYIKKLNS